MLTTRKKRRFQQTNPRPILGLCLILGLGTLAACAERTTHWSPTESPKKNQVSWAEFHHPVKFAKSSAKLDKAEKAVLSRFLARVGRGEGVKVMLATGSVQPSSLTNRRETSLARYLQESGITVTKIEATQSTLTQADTVRVTVGRHVVKPPACPDWSKPATGDPANQQTSNYGCATETNLGLMVADPGVLVRGTELGPTDGEVLAKGVKDYRKGTAEKAKAVSTQETGR